MARITALINRVNPTRDPRFGYVVHTSAGVFRTPAGDMPLEVGKVLTPPPEAVIEIEGRKILGIHLPAPASP